MVRDAVAAAGLPPRGDLAAHRVRVRAGQFTGTHHDAHRRFGILEPHLRRTTELYLRRVHEVKYDDLMAALQRLTALLARRGMVVLISDLLFDRELRTT